jgi:hypothetical protein
MPLLFVPGNHEYYHSSIREGLAEDQQLVATLNNVTLLGQPVQRIKCPSLHWSDPSVRLHVFVTFSLQKKAKTIRQLIDFNDFVLNLLV